MSVMLQRHNHLRLIINQLQLQNLYHRRICGELELLGEYCVLLPPENTSLFRALITHSHSDKVYALVDKALAEKSLVLDFQPDPSLLPEEPTVAPQQPVVASEKSAKAILDWERDSLMSDDSIGAATYDVLAARAIERGRKADIKAELVKSQINNEESNKLLVLLPAIADTVRSLSRRLNRTRMLKKDCVDSVAASMHLKHREALAGVDQLAAIIPEFFSVEPSEDGVPAVAHINTALVYKEVRGFIVEYVKSQSL